METSPVNIFSHLAIIAQVSATLMGFIAVFIILSNKEGRFSQSDRHFILAMVLAASYAFILALLPGTMSYYVTGTDLWWNALIVALVVGLGSAIYQAHEQFTMKKEEAQKIHWAWHVIAWGLAAFMPALIISGLFGLVDEKTAYITTATISVILALWSFIAVVFRKFF